MNMEMPRTHVDSFKSPRTHELMSKLCSTVDYFGAFSVARASLKASFNAFPGGKPHVYQVTDLCFCALGSGHSVNLIDFIRNQMPFPSLTTPLTTLKRCQKQKCFVLKGQQAEAAPKRRMGEQRPPLEQVQRLATRRTRGSKGPGDEEQMTCFICLSILFVLKTFVSLTRVYLLSTHQEPPNVTSCQNSLSSDVIGWRLAREHGLLNK